MPPPLLDIDANPRQAGFRSTPPSKIPSPPKAQRDRRSPFSASTAGSPRYTAMSVSSKTTVTPKTSKIPRRSTPTLVTPPSGNTKSRDNSAQYQRLPSSNAMQKSPATSSSLNSVRTPRHCFLSITADRVGTKEALPPVKPQQTSTEPTICTSCELEESPKSSADASRRRCWESYRRGVAGPQTRKCLPTQDQIANAAASSHNTAAQYIRSCTISGDFDLSNSEPEAITYESEQREASSDKTSLSPGKRRLQETCRCRRTAHHKPRKSVCKVVPYPLGG
jgi:hypothetical protein